MATAKRYRGGHHCKARAKAAGYYVTLIQEETWVWVCEKDGRTSAQMYSHVKSAWRACCEDNRI